MNSPPALPKPLLIRVCFVFAVLIAVLAAVVLVRTLATVLLTGPSARDTRSATVAEVMPALFFVLMGLVAAAIAYAIWKERDWARPLGVLFWFLYACAVTSVQALVQTVAPIAAFLTAMPFLGVAWWYFYRKATVVAYYAALRARRQGAA